MITIELNRKQIKLLYAVIIATGLFFILTTSPLIVIPIVEGQALSVNSLSDFIKFQLDLKHERNVATWYSSCLLLLAAIAALINLQSNSHLPKASHARRAGWAFVALILIGLSADETATIHETLAPLINFLNKGNQSGQVAQGAGDWILLLLPLIVILAIAMALFFWLTFRKQKKILWIALGGILCWACVIFAESIEGKLWNFNLPRDYEGLIEEGLEVAGTIMLIIAFVEYRHEQQYMDAEAYGGKVKEYDKTQKSSASRAKAARRKDA